MVEESDKGESLLQVDGWIVTPGRADRLTTVPVFAPPITRPWLDSSSVSPFVAPSRPDIKPERKIVRE
jgi:hypothetical protein